MKSLWAWVRGGRGLAGFAAVVLGFMVLVILWGAVVRATGSGAGCGNHWPLCNGDFFPHHPRLATVIEFVHRSMSGIETGLVAVLIGWTFLSLPKGHRARKASAWCGVLLLVEGALGAILVKGGYVEGNTSAMRVVMQGVHFTNTMLLLAAMTLSWWWVRERNAMPLPEARIRLIAYVALAATVVMGATGAMAALADTLFPSTSLREGILQDFSATAPLLIRMRWLHPAAAMVGFVFVVWLGVSMRSRARTWLFVLLAMQVVLGVLDVLLLAPVWLQVLHLLGADFYWIALVVICSECFQGTARARRKVSAVEMGHTLIA